MTASELVIPVTLIKSYNVVGFIGRRDAGTRSEPGVGDVSIMLVISEEKRCSEGISGQELSRNWTAGSLFWGNDSNGN
jgi:hypothetical protein